MVDRRRARAEDIEPVTDVITAAFAHDPLWGPALESGGDRVRGFWRLFVEGALTYPVSGIVGDYDAVSLWIPPGGDELTDELETHLEALLASAMPSVNVELHDLFDLFEASRPHEPHGYLTLLATRPESRGRGVGMALLRADLEDWDAEGVATYLESSNPGNDARYSSVGFRPRSGFAHPRTGALVTTMWRDVGGT